MTKTPKKAPAKKTTVKRRKKTTAKASKIDRRHLEKGGALIYGFSIGGALVMGVLVGLALIGDKSADRMVEEDHSAISYGADAGALVELVTPKPKPTPIEARTPPKPIPDPVTPQTARGPMMVIVIDDMGMNSNTTDKFARIGAPLTFAFLPYAEDLELQTRSISRHGHELMVHMPMEPETWDQNPGPKALLRDLEPAELRERLNWNLNRFEGFSGINNHMGSLFTQSPAHMKLVMNDLLDSGLYFLDSRTTPKSVGLETARLMGVPSMSRDVFLDNEREVDKIIAQLEKAYAISLRRGWSISIGHPYAQTLKALDQWLPEAKQKGVRFVHMSKLIFDSPYAPQKMASANKAPAISHDLPVELGQE